MPRIYTRTPLIDRIMAKVEHRDGHWLWTGATGSSGYGHVARGGRDGGMVSVHRTVYEHHKGPIPDGLVLDHLDACLILTCCNPEHLEPVTHAENQRRRAARRTTCAYGHPWTPASTRTTAKGRECRICRADQERARRAAKRANGLTSRGAPIESEMCRQGRHVRTPENTAVHGTRISCRDCMSESAVQRALREDRGSGAPQSRTAANKA